MLGVVPKTKLEWIDGREISFHKDRGYSIEIRKKNDSYNRIDRRKGRQNTWSSVLLNKYSDPQIEDEFRVPFGKAKNNNYCYQPANDDAESKILNTKNQTARISQQINPEKYSNLKNENRKLIWMIENSNKLFKKKLRESQKNIDKIMSVIKKFWKILQKQIMDPYQRRFYFDKNSPEEISLK